MKNNSLGYGNLSILFSFLLIFFLINLSNFFKDAYSEKSLINIINDKTKEYTNFIAHAGGGYNLRAYTNSLSAVQNSLENGFKFIEIDLLSTKDNKIIGSHDWKSLKELCKNFTNISENYLYQDFVKCNSNLDLKLIDEFDIKKIMDDDKEDNIYFVTDQIQDFKLLAKNFSGYEKNMIVEAHNIINYFIAKKYFPHVSLTFNDGKRYEYFVKLFNVNFIVIKSSLVDKYKDFLSEYIKNNVIMAHTTNEKKFIDKNLDKYVTMFYTDFWNFNENKCTANVLDTSNNSPCHTY